jgi:hypothetical protein
MKKNLLLIVGTAALALGVSSCAYDPYYGGGNTRSSVAVGYGYGHGYGGSSFSTSFFWSTGDPRWGYDPYARSYYDFHRRAYYDPYLYGYYPVGYRPPILIGVPHPIGYRHGYCPPPRRVTNVTVVNYRNRESAYRNTNHSWARNVKYDSKHRSSSTDVRSRDGSRTRDADRSRQGQTNWGGRTTSTRDSGFTTAATTDSRNQWDGRNRDNSRQASPAANRQGRTSALQPSAVAPRPPARQEFDRGNRVRESVPRQRANPELADWGRRQAQEASGRQVRENRSSFDGGRRAQPTPPPARVESPSSGGRGQRSAEPATSASNEWRGRADESGRGGRR